MYEVLRVTGLKNKSWSHVPLLGLTFGELFTYDRVYIDIIHPDYTGFKQIDFHDIMNGSGTDDSTEIVPYLQGFVNITVPTTTYPESKILSRPMKMKYYSIFDRGYTADIASLNADENGGYLGGVRNDIKITAIPSTITAAKDKFQHSLFMVNGRVVDSDAVYGNDIYLRDQIHRLNDPSLPTSRRNISVLDFTELGGFDKIKFDGNVTVRNSESTVNRRIVDIDIPNVSGKYPILVLNGHVMIDRGLWGLNGNTLTLVLNVDRLIAGEHRKADQLSWIQPASLSGDGYNLGSFDELEFLKEASSLILIDDDGLGVSSHHLGRTTIPGRYVTGNIPQGLLCLEDNTVADYHIEGYDNNSVSITASLPVSTTRLIDTVGDDLLVSTLNQPVADATKISRGIMWNVYKL